MTCFVGRLVPATFDGADAEDEGFGGGGTKRFATAGPADSAVESCFGDMRWLVVEKCADALGS
jgi:hypothetical protein